MKKYLFLYWNPPAPDRQPSPEEMQGMLAQWADWKEKFKDKVINMGDGLHHTGKVLKAGEVSDGPYPESKEIIGGFSVVQGKDIDDVMDVARACPITLMPGGVIEIRPMMGF